MPDNDADGIAAATLDARVAIDSAERLNERLEESDKLIDAFDDKPINVRDHDDLDPNTPSAHEDHLVSNFSQPSPNAADTDVIQESVEKPDDLQQLATKPAVEEGQPGQQSNEVEQTSSEKHTTENEITAAAEKAAASAAASAVALTASVPSAVAVPNIPLQGLQTAPYPSFATLSPSAAHLMAHPLVSMSIPTARRAVRIAPMGVLPLPPHGTNHLVPEIPPPTTPIMTAPQDTTMDGQIAAGTSTIGEMPKGKRRGLSVAVMASEALSPEERTKQKRMLRNRESAARSRDKRKNQNIQLETSIAKHRAKQDRLEKSIKDLTTVVQTMQDMLKKHDITIPT